MKNKLLAGLLAAAMVAAMATGCAGGSGSSSSESGEKKEGYTIGISQFAEHGSLDNCREGFIAGLAEAGIKEGFIILDINNARVRSQKDVEEIYKAIMHSDASDKVMFITGVYPTGRKVYYAVDLSD